MSAENLVARQNWATRGDLRPVDGHADAMGDDQNESYWGLPGLRVYFFATPSQRAPTPNLSHYPDCT